MIAMRSKTRQKCTKCDWTGFQLGQHMAKIHGKHHPVWAAKHPEKDNTDLIVKLLSSQKMTPQQYSSIYRALQKAKEKMIDEIENERKKTMEIINSVTDRTLKNQRGRP